MELCQLRLLSPPPAASTHFTCFRSYFIRLHTDSPPTSGLCYRIICLEDSVHDFGSVGKAPTEGRIFDYCATKLHVNKHASHIFQVSGPRCCSSAVECY
jgi:hypothetical protein